MATNANSMVQEAVDAAISKRGEIGLQVVAYVDGKTSRRCLGWPRLRSAILATHARAAGWPASKE